MYGCKNLISLVNRKCINRYYFSNSLSYLSKNHQINLKKHTINNDNNNLTTTTKDQIKLESNKKQKITKENDVDDDDDDSEHQYKSYDTSWYDFKGFEKLDVIPTGIISLDYQLGIGGIPKNHIIEISGESSSGKTTLALHIIGIMQRDDRNSTALFIDTENSFSHNWADTLGLDLSRCFISQPRCAEDAIDIISKSLKSKLFGTIVIDSLAGLIPEDQLDSKSISNVKYSWLDESLFILSNLIKQSNCSLIITNQLRNSFINHHSNIVKAKNQKDKEKPLLEEPKQYQNEELFVSYLSSKLEKYTDIKLELKRDRYLFDSSERIDGAKTNVYIKKNKLEVHSKLGSKRILGKHLPFFNINFNTGISNQEESLKLAEILNIKNTDPLNDKLSDQLYKHLGLK